MFENNLSGLSAREEKVFDVVCKEMNKYLRSMNIHFFDGEEDQILMDLWIDSFPFKRDAKGNYVYKTVREKAWEEVGGKMQEVIKEKEVRELDFTRSLVESYSVGFFVHRAKQLVINKCKYLFGEKRKFNKETGKMERQVDENGNDLFIRSKRDLSLKVNESDLNAEGEDAMTLDDIGCGISMDTDSLDMMCSLKMALNPTELRVVDKLLEGDSMNQVKKQFQANGEKLSKSFIVGFKERVGSVLREKAI